MIRFFIYVLLIPLFLNTSCAKLFVSYDGTVKKKEKSKVAEHYFSEGMKHYLLGEMSDAEGWFKKAYEITPENSGLNYILSKVSEEKKDLSQALLYAEKAVKVEEKNPYYHLQLAEIHRQQSNITEATKVYKKMITLFPENEENYFTLASLYLYQRKTDDAIEVYNLLENKFGKTPEISRQKQELFLKTNNPDAAIAESKSLMEAFPLDHGYKISYAELLVNFKKNDEAKKVLAEVLKEDSENPYAGYVLASIYRSEGKYDNFFELMVKVFGNPEMELDTKVSLLSEIRDQGLKSENKLKLLKLAASLPEAHPDNARAFMAYAEILIATDQKKDAWKQYLYAKQLDNTNYTLWHQLILLDSELNQIDSMVVHSEKALEVYPNQAAMWYLNGTAYMLAKKNDDAIASLEHGKRLAGNNNQLLLQFNILLGDTYNTLKEYQKSDDAYNAALSIEKDNPHILNNYSYFLALRNEKLDKALEMSERLMKVAPENSAYIDTYAWILYRLNRLEEAKKYLEKAIEKTNDGTIVEHYGDVLFKLGEIDKAVDEWNKARKLGQASELIDKKIADRKLYE